MKFIYRIFIPVLYIFFATPSYAVPDNLHFSGHLISTPCMQITSSDVSFNTIDRADIYDNTRSESVPFSVFLSYCNPLVSNSLTVTFSGQETTTPPGYLEVSGDASGIMIGIETANGQFLPLNQATGAIPFVAGSNRIDFSAFVQGKPDAIQNHTIASGDFSGVATFIISYI